MAQFPSTTTADGIWTLKQQRRNVLGETWPTIALIPVDYLVVGGGGGGSGGLSGVYWGGGGGAGVARLASGVGLTAGATYTVTIGAGGAAPTNPTSAIDGNPGTSSSISGTGLSVTATPGDGNPHDNHLGGANADFSGGVATGLGNGGGAGAAGNGSVLNGGPALVSSITGASQSYGGGGAGKNDTDGTPGTGGGTSLIAGAVNTGSGGGGTSSSGGGTAGGSGVVILRTLLTASATTGSPTVTTDGSFNIYTFTGSGSITF